MRCERLRSILLATVITPSAKGAEYPREREADIALRHGGTVHVRPVCAEDEGPICSFLEGLSKESIGFRFFGYPSLDWVTRWSLDVDYADRFGLVAITGDPPVVVAHAAYVRMNACMAEVAFWSLMRGRSVGYQRFCSLTLPTSPSGTGSRLSGRRCGRTITA